MKNASVLSLAATVAIFALIQAKRTSALTQIIHPPVNDSDEPTPLYFSLIQSFSSQYVSAHSVVGLELALDFTNADETLLPGYSLHYVFTDAPISLLF